jgi:hypothetical protein
LSGIAVPKRRQLAATLGLFAVLFVAVGAVAATDPSTAAIKAFVAIALVVAVILALMAWGVAHSIRVDLAERRLDSVLEDAVKAHGGQLCDCGHEHDPTELNFVGDDAGSPAGSHGATRADRPTPASASCAHDGAGADCGHSCDTCVLAGLRPSPAADPARPSPAPRGNAPRGDAARPSPAPRDDKSSARPAPTRERELRVP